VGGMTFHSASITPFAALHLGFRFR
jgi:hypothetical protein